MRAGLYGALCLQLTWAHQFQQDPNFLVRLMLKQAQDVAAFNTIDQVSPGEPPRPRVARRFLANMRYSSTETGIPTIGSGRFAQDADQKTLRVETMRPFPGATKTGLITNITILIQDNVSHDITGGDDPICRQLPMFGQQRFGDMFAWAAIPALSTYAGERVVAGRICSLWRFSDPDPKVHVKQTLCAAGDEPVELNVTLEVHMGGSPTKTVNTSYQFGPLTTGSEVPDYLFHAPAICNSIMPGCENGRGVEPVAMEAYVFHPNLSAQDYNIEDQNVADLHGDAIFICMDCLQNQSSFIDHNYTLISRYILEISPAFGQYAMCNGYPDTVPPGPHCVGGDPRLVGKEAPFFAGPGESRCASDSPIGFWYGLPKGGRCPPGQSPSKDAWAGGCTWAVKQRLKTIDQECLMKDHDYLQFCNADALEQKGFPRSAEALLAAFSSEDKSKGGCADVGGPDAASHETSFIV